MNEGRQEMSHRSRVGLLPPPYQPPRLLFILRFHLLEPNHPPPFPPFRRRDQRVQVDCQPVAQRTIMHHERCGGPRREPICFLLVGQIEHLRVQDLTTAAVLRRAQKPRFEFSHQRFPVAGSLCYHVDGLQRHDEGLQFKEDGLSLFAPAQEALDGLPLVPDHRRDHGMCPDRDAVDPKNPLAVGDRAQRRRAEVHVHTRQAGLRFLIDHPAREGEPGVGLGTCRTHRQEYDRQNDL